MQTIRTPEKRKAFLEALADTGNVKESCETAGISRNAAYLWKIDDAEFRADWERSCAAGGDSLEDEGMRRARDGWDEPVYHQGEVCGTVRKYSDTLLIFLLKGLKPEIYRERYEVDMNAKHSYAAKSDDELDSKIAELMPLPALRS